MRDWSDEMIRKTKGHFKEHYGVEMSTDDAVESLNNITQFIELLIELDEDRLRDRPCADCGSAAGSTSQAVECVVTTAYRCDCCPYR